MPTLEICGPPKAGKTLLVNALERIAREQNIEVRHFHGGGRYLPLSGKATASFNLAIAARNSYNLVCMDRRDTLINLLDRGIIDSLIFTRSLELDNKISKSNAESVRDFLMQEEFINLIDMVVILTASESTLEEREWKATGRRKDGAVHNRITRRNLIAASEEVYNTVSRFGIDVTMHNSDGPILDLLEFAQTIYSKIDKSPIGIQN